jgi:putative transposase
MPHSYTALYYHIVFATKERAPVLAADMRPRLYDYLSGIVRDERGLALAIGGVDDHVHLLVRLEPTFPVADVVRAGKAGSSKWVRDTFPSVAWPGWQSGYSAFTVATSGLTAICAYLAGQEEHHRRHTFNDELAALLKRHDVSRTTNAD